MGLTINRQRDNRSNKCLLHRIADIPGGVGVRTSNLGGKLLLEGTPLCKGKDGLWEVFKTAEIVSVDAEKKTANVKKGHHFVVGDAVGTESNKIKEIKTNDPSVDVLTLTEAVSGSTLAQSGEMRPIAVAGSTEDIIAGDNLFTSAWVIAVVNSETAPKVPAEKLPPTIVYI